MTNSDPVILIKLYKKSIVNKVRWKVLLLQCFFLAKIWKIQK